MSSREGGRAQRLHEAAEQVVDISNRAVIGVARGAHLGLCHRLGIHRTNMAQPARMRIERIPGRRHVDLRIAVEIPVALRHGERVMRMRERSDQQERPLISRSREIEDRALGHERRLIIEVELVRTHA